MAKFQMFISRKDRHLTGFSADDNQTLLDAICCNSTTGYVRQKTLNGPVCVPSHAANEVAAHLIKLGWEKA